MGAHPSVDLFDQSGLIDDAGYDAQVVNILHFYTWSIRCFVHAPQNTSPAKRTCGMWVRKVAMIPSCTGRQVYRVRYGGSSEESCSCPDFQFGHVCKYLITVGIMHAARRSGVKETRNTATLAGDPFKAASKRKGCPACFGGYVTLTVEEDGQ